MYRHIIVLFALLFCNELMAQKPVKDTTFFAAGIVISYEGKNNDIYINCFPLEIRRLYILGKEGKEYEEFQYDFPFGDADKKFLLSRSFTINLSSV